MNHKVIYRMFVSLIIGSMSAQAELVGHWTFDETKGTRAADSSEGKHHGKVSNPTWTSGLMGGGSEI